MKPVNVLLNGVAFGLTFGFVIMPLAAFAGTAPVPVPEPTTMGIFAIASAGTAIAYRLFRRK